MSDSEIGEGTRLMHEQITETGCNVRVRAYRAGEYTCTEGIYLLLGMAQKGDDRRAELRMTPEEARWLSEVLADRADALEAARERGTDE